MTQAACSIEDPQDFNYESAPGMARQEITPQITFLVQGLEKEPYQIVFTKTEDAAGQAQLICECECIAAAHGDLCGHRLRILEGSTQNIVSDNLDQVEQVRQWLIGTQLEKAIAGLVEAERLLDYAERQLSECRNQLAEVMAGG
jgi:hypothetical protein